MTTCPPHSGIDPNFGGSEGREGNPEGHYVANAVSSQKFEVDWVRELSESMVRAGSENAGPKNLQRRSVSEKEVEIELSPLIARKSTNTNTDLLQLTSVREPIKSGEDLIQHRTGCAKVNLLDAFHIG